MSTNPYQPTTSAASDPGAAGPPSGSPVWAIARSILGVLVGVVAGGLVVFLIEVPGMRFHPLPPGVTMSDTEALKAHFAKAPFVALLGVGIAWTLGPLAASWVAASIARWAWFGHGMVIAGIFAALDVMNIRSFPHPTWLVLIGVFAPFAMGWLGSALAEWMFTPRRPDPQPYDMRKKNMAC
ncbi:MAG: hypothetical protein L0211_00080 [Planctomycetaceae bacterium]|nr:hypothetical protein [Planctomycetaceae bacterium]